MNSLPQLVQTNIPFILGLVIAGAAFAAAWYLYRRPVPEISNTARIVLTGLRMLLLFFVILLFFKPSLFMVFSTTDNEKLGIFVDNSLSMKLETDSISSWQTALQAADKLRNMSEDSDEWLWYAFNSAVTQTVFDSLKLSQGGTNFERLLAAVNNEALHKAVIISDGNYTEGAYPFAAPWQTDTKIYTVGAGRTGGRGDILISDVDYQPAAYQGEKSILRVEVSGRDLAGPVKTRLNLLKGRELLLTKPVTLADENASQFIDLEYVPGQTGLQKLTVRLDPASWESAVSNNSSAVIQEVFKSHIKTAVFSGRPGYEGRFINLLLGQDDDIVCRLYAEDRSGRFIGMEKNIPWDSLDVLILQDYPGPFSRSTNIQKITELLQAGKAGAVFFLGDSPDFSRMTGFKSFLPFAKMPAAQNNALAGSSYAAAENQENAFLNLLDDFSLNSRFWQTLPPLEIHHAKPVLKKKADILLEASLNTIRFPIIISSGYKQNIFYTFFGSGFWRWHFLLQGEPELQPGYKNLLVKIIRRLADRSPLKRVALKTRAKTGNPGKKITLNAVLFNSDFERIKNGGLVLKARWNNQSFDIAAVQDSSGRFTAELVPPGEGRYTVTASGYSRGSLIGRDSLQIEVIPTVKEFLQSTQNVKFLSRLAKMGSGSYVSAAGLDSLRSILQPERIVNRRESNIELWYKPFLLVLIILTASLEWLLRKRWGLV